MRKSTILENCGEEDGEGWLKTHEGGSGCAHRLAYKKNEVLEKLPR
jgi:hypothetical protein